MSSWDLPKLWTTPTKIGHIGYFNNQSFQKSSFIKVDTLVDYFSQEKNSERFSWFLKPKNNFDHTNFANFEEVVHNFGRSDDDMVYWKNAYIQYIYADMVWCPTWSSI